MEEQAIHQKRLQHERQELRLEARNGRDALSCVERVRASAVICQRLCALAEMARAESILLYRAFRSEVATETVFQTLRQQGKTVCLPRTVPERKILLPLIWDGEIALQPGYRGILEPELQAGRVVPPDTLDIVVVPGLLFDRSGNRLGYGGGYYDRFLALQAPQALRIGLAFSCQIIASIPAMAHDIPLHVVVTDREIWRCP